MTPGETSDGQTEQPDGAQEPAPGGTGQEGGAQAGDGGTKPPGETDGPDNGIPEEPIGDADILVTEAIRRDVTDALTLADFAIKTGFKKSDGRTLATEPIRVIKVTAGKIKLFEQQEAQVTIKASEWTRFEFAYYALADFTSPVTAETLRDTESTGHGLRAASNAQQFTWLLWGITGVLAAFVIFSAAVATEGLYVADLGTWTDTFKTLNPYLQILAPYAYGGLGACAYLLRSAHSLIYQRSFDVRRKPEYLNRILLGVVSGGAITLFVSQLTDEEDNVIRLSSAALGFIAGYSNDFLFNAIERVVAAILPRVGLESVQRAAPAPTRPPLEVQTGGLTLRDLMTRMESATGEDKELYRSLIAKLRDRL